VPAAIAKGVEEAKKHFFRVPRIASTIPHMVQGEEAAGVVLLKPASPGPASSPAARCCRARVRGIHDVLSRSLGSSNPINVVHATVAALKSLSRPEEIAAKRGLPIEDVAPAAMLRARARGGRGLGADHAQLKVTQVKSKIGGNSDQRNSLRSLGRTGSASGRQAGSARVSWHDQGRAPLVTVEEVD